jgi:hypothetical protein
MGVIPEVGLAMGTFGKGSASCCYVLLAAIDIGQNVML